MYHRDAGGKPFGGRMCMPRVCEGEEVHGTWLQGLSPIRTRKSTKKYEKVRIRGEPGITNRYENVRIVGMMDMTILPI